MYGSPAPVQEGGPNTRDSGVGVGRLEGSLGTQVPAASGDLPWLSVDPDQLLSPA